MRYGDRGGANLLALRLLPLDVRSMIIGPRVLCVRGGAIATSLIARKCTVPFVPVFVPSKDRFASKRELKSKGGLICTYQYSASCG